MGGRAAAILGDDGAVIREAAARQGSRAGIRGGHLEVQRAAGADGAEIDDNVALGKSRRGQQRHQKQQRQKNRNQTFIHKNELLVNDYIAVTL